ncbi:UDP-4-amino-4,6-dideoxy-N-acetyl-beta-L-altrosamine N-acetyltransferase [Paraglaciecola sp. 20A4]|uniref:UDP-4-amino-4, 6-dideoxy-N-acetyl-beta-L-altrosamine N-acetyltransferase n=1 Tax=Paraglaciecola sp. 20A4 TaxID=2687288 RepID=UPI001408C25A|nr:UDP-4-amino-4,6-dideoxy-N-acetyl-beta-L-altrosamine N-acetyltransferase [Paraglaciecola sp. 20A4]
MSSTASEHCFIPINASHLSIVWHWRNSDRVRANMHYDKLITWEEHKDWFDALLHDPNRECWIYCQHARPIGVLNFSETQQQVIQWGCYLGEVNCAPGSGLILEWAALEYAAQNTNCIGLDAQVLSFNTAALKLHKLFNYTLIKIESGGMRIRNEQSELEQFDIHFFHYAMHKWRQHRDKVLTTLPKPIQRGCQQVTFLSKEQM